jgi:hypothetical protein
MPRELTDLELVELALLRTADLYPGTVAALALRQAAEEVRVLAHGGRFNHDELIKLREPEV